MSSGTAARGQCGLTLIELIVFIVIVSIGLVGVLSVLNATTRASADPVVRKQALAVAEAMMEEVLSKDYQDPSGDCTPATAPSCKVNTVADRPNYNDVSDYNGWNQTGVYQIDGSLAPVLGTYTVAVAVTALTVSGVPGKQVAVTVGGGSETITLNGFRANF